MPYLKQQQQQTTKQTKPKTKQNKQKNKQTKNQRSVETRKHGLGKIRSLFTEVHRKMAGKNLRSIFLAQLCQSTDKLKSISNPFSCVFIFLNKSILFFILIFMNQR